MKNQIILSLIFFQLVFLYPFRSSAQSEIDSLKKVFHTIRGDSLKMQAVNRIILNFYVSNELDSAIRYIKIMETYVNQKKLEVWRSNVFNHYGNLYRAEYNYEKSLKNYRSAIQLAVSQKDILRLAHFSNNLGSLFEDFAKWNSAILMFAQSGSIFEYLNKKKEFANSLNNLGNVYHLIADYPKALNSYFKAYLNYEMINNQEGLAWISNNIANIYSDQKNYSKASKYYLLSINHCRKTTNQESLFQSYDNLAINYSLLNQTQLAAYYFSLADTLINKNNFDYLLPNHFMVKGEFESSLKNFKLALEYFKRANEAAINMGDSLQYVYIKSAVGFLYFNNNQLSESEKELLSAYSLLKRYKTSDLEIAINRNLYKLYQRTGDYKKALVFFEQFINAEKQKDIENSKRFTDRAELKHKYDLEMFDLKQAQLKRLLQKAEEEKIQKMILITILIIASLIIVFSIFLYKRYKISKSQNIVIQQQKQEVLLKNHSLEIKNKEILDSISYARRIQHALLAHDELLQKHLHDYFILFKPKDIVSGDFYWATSTGSVSNHTFYLAVCDSTGHGVPGAFMSLLNINLLNEAINEKQITAPNEVFNHVREGLIKNISQEGQRDGMDGILLKVDYNANNIVQLSYAAANNAPVLISNKQVLELPKDKMPVGIGVTHDSFKLNSINAQKGDMLYLYTDGYADQFGGQKGKKFKYKTLNELLLNISELTVVEQKEKLNTVFEEWRGNLEQLDDVCIIGIRI